MKNSFEDLVKNKIKFNVFLLKNLPSAFFSGVRVKEFNSQEAVVTIPYKWFSTNPFRSTYFACLAMAAELSTGLLAMRHTYSSVNPVSMLVLKIEADFVKKATGLTTFTCEDGMAFKNIVDTAISTKEGITMIAKTEGKDVNGNTIAKFSITWSFKAK